eukprot:1215234-Pleurochrysis_carterae.AAC.1
MDMASAYVLMFNPSLHCTDCRTIRVHQCSPNSLKLNSQIVQQSNHATASARRFLYSISKLRAVKFGL